jgi:hypothetical protein
LVEKKKMKKGENIPFPLMSKGEIENKKGRFAGSSENNCRKQRNQVQQVKEICVSINEKGGVCWKLCCH